MNITLERDAFLAALQRVIGSVDRKGTVLALQHVACHAEDGKLRLTATNMEMQSTTTCDCATDAATDFSLPAQTALDILNNLWAGAQVTLTRTEGDPRVHLACGRSRFRLPTVNPATIPVMSRPEGAAATVLAGDLDRTLDACTYGMSKDATQYVFRGMFIKSEEGKITCAAMDDKRGGVAWCAAGGVTEGGVLPPAFVAEMGRMASGVPADSPVALLVKPGVAMVEAGATVLIGKVIDGEYADYENRIVALPRAHTLKVDHDLIVGAVKRALIMAPDGGKSLRLVMSEDAVSITARNNDSGEADNDVECEWDGEPGASFAINGGYLADALARMTKEMVSIQIGNKVPILMREDDRLAIIGVQRG